MNTIIRGYKKSDANDVKKVFARCVEYHAELDNCYNKVDGYCDKFVEHIEEDLSKGVSHCSVAEIDDVVDYGSETDTNLAVARERAGLEAPRYPGDPN